MNKKNESENKEVKTVDYSSLEIEGVDTKDYPDFCDTYFSAGYFTDGSEMSDEDLEELSDESGELLNEMAHESCH